MTSWSTVLWRSVHRLALALLGLAALAIPAAAQLPNQSFEVVPQVAHATVGDPVAVRFRVRLDPQDLLYDSVPSPTSDPPDGVRILAVEKLSRGPNRDYTGRAQVAFYRTGRQAVPVFGLPFMRGVKGVTRATLTSDSAFVEIDPVIPPGNPPLRDIRGIVRARHHGLWPVAGVLALVTLALAGGLIARRRRAAGPPLPRPVEPPAVPPVAASGPYDRALARLAHIEREEWPARGDVARHYVAVVDTLRRYLEEAHGVPALASTTSELSRTLPPALTHAGPGDYWTALLGEAALVKFAGVRPEAHAAASFSRDARMLLDAWHAAAPIPTPIAP